MSIEELAEEAKVSPDTLSDLEAQRRNPRGTTWSKVRKALDALEEEMGFPPIDEAPPEATVRVIRVQIGDVAVEGPVGTPEDLAELEASALRLSRLARETTQDDVG